MSLIGENQPDSYDKLTCKANAMSLIGENQPDSYDKLTCKAKGHQSDWGEPTGQL